MITIKPDQKGVEDPSVPVELRQFMKAVEGRNLLSGTRHFLKGHTIKDVKFSPTEGGITTTLVLEHGEYFPFEDAELSLVSLREEFGSVFHNMTLAAKE